MGCSSSLPSSSSSSSSASPASPASTTKIPNEIIKEKQKESNKNNNNNEIKEEIVLEINENKQKEIRKDKKEVKNNKVVKGNKESKESKGNKDNSNVIPSSKYIGHLSKPLSAYYNNNNNDNNNNNNNNNKAEEKTPTHKYSHSDSEFIASLRAPSPQKRSTPTSNKTLPSINSGSKSSPGNDSNGRSVSVGRPPFNVSSNSSTSSTSTTKNRKSTGGIPETKKGNSRNQTTNNNRNINGNRQKVQKPTFLEKAREDGRSPNELELIETIEREIVQGKLNVTWDSIGGLKQAKDLLQEAVVLPQLIPDYFQGIRRPWRGILMFGPPGTGKTMLAKAVASECSCTFLNVSASTLGSKWRGESEKMVRILFEIAAYYSPSTIFIDEIDSIAGARGKSSEHEASRRVKTELMVQMDGMNSELSRSVTPTNSNNNNNNNNNNNIQAPRKSSFNGTTRNGNNNTRGTRANTNTNTDNNNSNNSNNSNNNDDDSSITTPNSPPMIIVIAATNTPWDLDEALKRRFEKRIYIPLPDLEGRIELFRMNMQSLEVHPDVDYEELGRKSNGYSGADITNVCRDASMMGMRRFMEEARNKHLSTAEIQNILTNSNNSDVTLKLQSVVTRSDFLTSLSKINKSVNEKELKIFEDWKNQYGSS